ncbi:hypothetical protein V6N13_088958 [Hibiscus sabdariffa]|uniref:Uncharacterized protein n=1 Tax=Hibiscus sabdariffa TaxID=183260 RepID=A0ABR2G0X7_9ROSI
MMMDLQQPPSNAVGYPYGAGVHPYNAGLDLLVLNSTLKKRNLSENLVLISSSTLVCETICLILCVRLLQWRLSGGHPFGVLIRTW